jgi:hypothetical protein
VGVHNKHADEYFAQTDYWTVVTVHAHADMHDALHGWVGIGTAFTNFAIMPSKTSISFHFMPHCLPCMLNCWSTTCAVPLGSRYLYIHLIIFFNIYLCAFVVSVFVHHYCYTIHYTYMDACHGLVTVSQFHYEAYKKCSQSNHAWSSS